jgi:AcrR family transcriptional regulator
MSSGSQHTRELLIEETRQALSINGAANLMLKDICARLGFPASLVNYHFGSRERLIAEATVLAYEGYVKQNLAAIDAAGTDPEARVRAWIWSQYDWTIANPGIAAILNYSTVAPGVGEILNTEFTERIQTSSLRNLVAIFKAVREVHLGTVTDEIPTIEMMDDKEYSTVTAIVMWVTLGVSTWASGRHIPTRMTAETIERNKVVESVIDRVLEMARGLK